MLCASCRGTTEIPPIQRETLIFKEYQNKPESKFLWEQLLERTKKPPPKKQGTFSHNDLLNMMAELSKDAYNPTDIVMHPDFYAREIAPLRERQLCVASGVNAPVAMLHYANNGFHKPNIITAYDLVGNVVEESPILGYNHMMRQWSAAYSRKVQQVIYEVVREKQVEVGG